MEWKNIRLLIAVARKLCKCVTKESEESCEKNKHFDRLRDCRRNWLGMLERRFNG